eukprot:CAMPEP_0183708704 /NCGR_PEP_ID=MMETSP0737-20130205/4923_1 /TAXON_ID=385413 /ORGANISM="Thalassiosira miniscula, Strain CCMP1093" /LENGTH=181 /DNA_ID=CAMNT_0025936613 /DNA_START=104 /DNA_END=649 /DNA_ORIENTATION=-
MNSEGNASKKRECSAASRTSWAIQGGLHKKQRMGSKRPVAVAAAEHTSLSDRAGVCHGYRREGGLSNHLNNSLTIKCAQKIQKKSMVECQLKLMRAAILQQHLWRLQQQQIRFSAKANSPYPAPTGVDGDSDEDAPIPPPSAEERALKVQIAINLLEAEQARRVNNAASMFAAKNVNAEKA